MDVESLLRRYLEQRRELGETELVLDRLTVEEVLRVLGASRGAWATAAESVSADPRPRAARPEREPAPPADRHRRGDEPTADTADWREALRATGAEPSPPAPARPAPIGSPDAPPLRVEPGVAPVGVTGGGLWERIGAIATTGLVVGSAERELFVGAAGAAKSLEQIAEMTRACTRCDLYRTAKQAVPGEGSPSAALMCVGEAPGEKEDETGRPFVGAAGQLLTKILGAINLTRDEVFIANVLKHRPPGNRNPRPEEVEACRPYLVRQIELVQPSVIVAFGTFAAQSLLETKLPISKLRGAVHRYHGVPVVVTYHPAALLRNPAWKRPTWEDVQLARRILDLATAA